MRLRRTLSVSCLATFFAVGLFAQTTVSIVGGARRPTVPKEAPEFGTTDWTAVRLNAFDFTTLTGAPYKSILPAVGISRYALDGPLEASVRVPSGALIRRIEFDYCDTNAASHMTMALIGCDNQGQNCSYLFTPLLVSAGDGCTWVSNAALSIPVDNFHSTYTLEVQFGEIDGTNLLTGAIISYQLQVSPAPSSASFGDVPTSHPQFQFIEALAASGITAGCGGGNFCPGASLTRGQMAVFLSKALGLHFPE